MRCQEKSRHFRKKESRFKSRLCHLRAVSCGTITFMCTMEIKTKSPSIPCSDEKGTENMFCKLLQGEPGQGLTTPGTRGSGGHRVLCHLPQTLLLPQFSQPCTITPEAPVLFALQTFPLLLWCPSSSLRASCVIPEAPPHTPTNLVWLAPGVRFRVPPCLGGHAETSTLPQLHNENENWSMLITLINFLKTKQRT